MPAGLYDQLLTDALREAVTRTTDERAHSLQPLPAKAPPADALASQLSRILDDLHGDGAEKLRQQLDFVNFLLVSLKQRLGKRAGDAETLSVPPQILQAIHQQSPKPAIPETGLAFPWLFTAGKGSPGLLTELRREQTACDQVDILVSFITHSGVRKLLDILQSITAVGPDGKPRTRLRVLTTTCTGATEIRALDVLARLAEVDPHLLARRGLEADRRTAARFKLPAEPSARPLDRALAEGVDRVRGTRVCVPRGWASSSRA